MNEEGLGKYYSEGIFPAINKLFSPLSGIDSVADVVYNTDPSNLESTLSQPVRYLLNILKGAAGILPGVETPKFKGVSDIMKKYQILNDSPDARDIIGFGGDMLSSPSMYMGAGALKKIGLNGLKKIKGLSSLY